MTLKYMSSNYCYVEIGHVTLVVLNDTPFVHARVYLQYFNSALPGSKLTLGHVYPPWLNNLLLYPPMIRENRQLVTHEPVEFEK